MTQTKTTNATATATSILMAAVFVLLATSRPVSAADIRDIIFPVIGSTRFSDDFGAPRTGHTHQGNDVFGTKMQKLVAVISGYLNYVPYPEPYYGYAIFLQGEDGYEYWYLHMNNDTPGTDDGRGGGLNAFAPDIMSRVPVTKGQLLGYIGDSGNAESTSPHLHFEIHRPDNNVINPFLTLSNAPHIAGPIFHPPMPGEIVPFVQFQGGASVARGDVDPDTAGEEVIIGAGAGGGPNVKVYSSDNVLLAGFFPFPEGFRGGVDVATGDVDGDGIDEIISAAGPGGGPQVSILDRDGTLKGQFLAYDKGFRGGVRVSAADVNGDGLAEVITVPASNGGPHVKIFNRWGERLGQFFAFDPSFRKSLDVAASPADEFHGASIVVSVGAGGGPQIRVFNTAGTLQAQFFAFDEKFRGGAHVDIGEVKSNYEGYEIVAVPANAGGAQIRTFSLNGQFVGDYTAFEPWWRGGYDIGAGTDALSISTQTSGRRTSVRDILYNQGNLDTF